MSHVSPGVEGAVLWHQLLLCPVQSQRLGRGLGGLWPGALTSRLSWDCTLAPPGGHTAC